MRIIQPVSTSRPCGHCDGAGKCLCKACSASRPVAEKKYGIALKLNDCAFCLGRRFQQQEITALAPPGSVVNTHQRGDRPKRPRLKKPIRKPPEGGHVVTRRDWKNRGK